jgi:hypothetical protein
VSSDVGWLTERLGLCLKQARFSFSPGFSQVTTSCHWVLRNRFNGFPRRATPDRRDGVVAKSSEANNESRSELTSGFSSPSLDETVETVSAICVVGIYPAEAG